MKLLAAIGIFLGMLVVWLGTTAAVAFVVMLLLGMLGLSVAFWKVWAALVLLGIVIRMLKGK